MAKKMPKHTYYFKHDFNASNDEKILDLRMDLGFEGYGLFWHLIELLANAKGYELEINYKRLSFTVGVSAEILKKVIEDYGLFVTDDEKFYSVSLKGRMEDLDNLKQKRKDAGRKGGIAKAKAKQTPSNANDNPSKPLANPSREKKIREDKIKEDKNKINNDRFDSWYSSYDKKVDRGKAEKKWSTLSSTEQDKCMEVVSAYVKSTPEKKYRKNPSTYLNSGSWENEIQVNNPIVNSNFPEKKTYQEKCADRIKESIELAEGIANGTIPMSDFEPQTELIEVRNEYS